MTGIEDDLGDDADHNAAKGNYRRDARGRSGWRPNCHTIKAHQRQIIHANATNRKGKVAITLPKLNLPD